MTHLNKATRWQNELIQAVTDPATLLQLLELDPALLPAALASAKLFPLKVPRGFVARMEKGNPHDPLLRQVLPLDAEMQETPGYEIDPLQEANKNPIPGVLHKYHGRILLTLVGNCAINCRFCFRRHFPYESNTTGNSKVDQTLDYIRNDTSIQEVILSGGDPLVANDAMLKNLTQQLTEISHIKRLRIHTRIPIVLPSRITPEFLDAVTTPKLKTILIVHTNHPNEIDTEVAQAIELLRNANITLLNQSVLLKGVNDDPVTLTQLSEALFQIGIQPYYLHVLDKVQGTAHFDMPLQQARLLHEQIANQLPGYLVPKLVCEQPGAPAKILLSSADLYTG